MSVLRDKHVDEIAFECDDCGDVIETDETQFSAAVQVIKDNKWTVMKDEHNEWKHICPGCNEDMEITE